MDATPADLMTRSELDAWLADTEWVVTGDILSPDAVRCRPGTPAGPTFAETAAAMAEGMRTIGEWWSATAASLGVAIACASDAFVALAETIHRQLFEDAARQAALDQPVVTLRAKFNPPPLPDLPIPMLPPLPIRHGHLGVTCPRHGPMHGGICHRCRR